MLPAYFIALIPLNSKNTEEQQTISNKPYCKLIINFILLLI